MTPGPWKIEPGGGHAYPCIRGAEVIHTNGRDYGHGRSSKSYSDEVCTIRSDIRLPGPAANARAIAKVPEMVALLKDIVGYGPSAEVYFGAIDERRWWRC
jgi:hypothetical protein